MRRRMPLLPSLPPLRYRSPEVIKLCSESLKAVSACKS